MDINALLKRQEGILRDLAQIRFMKKGSVTHQRVLSKTVRGNVQGVRGPYPVLTWKDKGKTRSLRLKSGHEVLWAEQAIANYQRFAQLCREYESLAEQLALHQREEEREGAGQTLKKSPRSPLRSRRK